MSEQDQIDFLELLAASKSGDGKAWSQIMRLIYSDLKRIAHVNIGPRSTDNTLNTTALVNECYIRLVGAARSNINSRGHFLNLASRVMRQVLCDYARERLATKRGGEQKREDLAVLDDEELQEASTLVELDILLQQLEEVNPKVARVFECRYFAGLSEEEVANALDISTRTVQRHWQFARDWLSQHAGPD